MELVRVDIQSIVVGGGPMASLIVLKPRGEEHVTQKLPIRIGRVEAAAISMGVESSQNTRPMTHDLLANVIEAMGARVSSVVIHDVSGTTFYARVRLQGSAGEPISVDSRPSDAIALAVRTNAPIYADPRVLTTAALPDFGAVERDEREREVEAFHNFVEGLSPDDFVA